METVIAYEKVTTRIRPTQACVKPTPEPVTTMAGLCPMCGRETRVGLGNPATVYGSCAHFAGIEQIGADVRIGFNERPQCDRGVRVA